MAADNVFALRWWTTCTWGVCQPHDLQTSWLAKARHACCSSLCLSVTTCFGQHCCEIKQDNTAKLELSNSVHPCSSNAFTPMLKQPKVQLHTQAWCSKAMVPCISLRHRHSSNVCNMNTDSNSWPMSCLFPAANHLQSPIRHRMSIAVCHLVTPSPAENYVSTNYKACNTVN